MHSAGARVLREDDNEMSREAVLLQWERKIEVADRLDAGERPEPQHPVTRSRRFVRAVEEVDEELYRIDRFLFHVSSQPGFAKLRQLRLGRCALKANNRPFGAELEAVVRHWCERSGVAYGGRADIGHDALNRVVPFPLRNSSGAPS